MRAALVAVSCYCVLPNCPFAVTALVVRIRLLDEANGVAGISGIKCDGIVEKRGELSFFDGFLESWP